MKKYYWIPDVPDMRDHMMSVAAPTTLPTKVDLRHLCSPIENQGQLGSCTGNAIVGAMEILENKNNEKFIDLSRLFVYYNERFIEGTVKNDSGACIRDGIKALATYGVCTESLWPYKIDMFDDAPTKECFEDGLTRKIINYKRIVDLQGMKECLAAGYPFIFGMSIYESFESPEVAVTGVVNIPVIGEKSLGCHAILAVGYDDSTKRFLIRNSWGSGWGQKGYFTIPYEYLNNRNLSDDFWMITK